MSRGASERYDSSVGQTTKRDPIGLAGGVNQYGYAGGDPVNFSDPFGLIPVALATPIGAAAAAAAGSFVRWLAVGVLTAIAVDNAASESSGTAQLPSSLSLAAPADATVVYNRAEGKQIRAAIKAATGSQASNAQYDCMSQHIHECKESGDGGSKNDKGDFTWDELVKMAGELFKKP